METFSSLLAICAGNSPVNGEFPTHKGQWRGDLMFSFICAWINGWVNNRGPVDLRRHRAHYDVTVMMETGPAVLCNMKYACNLPNIPFAHHLFCRCTIFFKFCTEHGSHTAVLCAKIKTIWQLKYILWKKNISQGRCSPSYQYICFILVDPFPRYPEGLRYELI